MPEAASTDSWKDGILLKVRVSTVLIDFERASGRALPDLLAIIFHNAR